MGHTHGVNPMQTTGTPPPAPRRKTSPGQVFGLIAGYVVLAVIGAALGWTLTTVGPVTNAANTLPGPSSSAGSTGSAPAPHSSGPTSTHTTTPAGPTVPDFAASGTSFITARQQLMAKKIQAYIVFQGGSGDDTVVKSSPPAGSPMHKGDTVKLYVNESAPLLGVPNEMGKNCDAAGKDLAKVGFEPQYATGRNGVVQQQTPPAGAPNTHWYDHVTLTCAPKNQVNPSPSTGTSQPPNNQPSAPPSN